MDDDYIRSLEERIASAKEFLAPMEAGTMRVGRRPAGGEWADITDEYIQREHEAIAIYERLLAEARARRAINKMA